MRDAFGLFDQMRGLAEIGVHAGRGDKAGHLALFGDRAGISVVADLLVHRKRFPGQGRLIDAEIGALDQLHVGGNDIAEFYQHDVARNQQPRLDVLPDAVALDARLERQALLEQRDGVVGLVFLEEANAGVDEQHDQNNDEIGPMLERG